MRHNTVIDEPYFMTNEKWYYFDKEAWRYKLTEDAPPEAIESYKDFYAEITGGADHGSHKDQK